MSTHTIDTLKETIEKTKLLKTRMYRKALEDTNNETAAKALLVAESLAMAECHSQCALIRLLRLEQE